MLAVCGAFQLLGRVYLDGRGRAIPGLGLLELGTVAGLPRLVGEVVTRSREGELLTGFENHGGRSVLGPGLEPLGRVLRGGGNNGADATEGARQGNLVGTYLHGPVLARNPALADLLLGQALERRGRQLGPLRSVGRDRAADPTRPGSRPSCAAAGPAEVAPPAAGSSGSHPGGGTTRL